LLHVAEENSHDEGYVSVLCGSKSIVNCTAMTEVQDLMSSEDISFKKKNRKQFRKRSGSSEESNHSEEEKDDYDVR